MCFSLLLFCLFCCCCFCYLCSCFGLLHYGEGHFLTKNQTNHSYTWASQREPKFKNALRFFSCCFLSWVTNRRLGPNTHAGIKSLFRSRTSCEIFEYSWEFNSQKNYRFDCEFVLKNYSNWPIPCILNSFCEMFEKHAPHGAINSLRNGLVVPSNRLRVSRLAFRIIRVSFLGVNKDFSE